MDIGENVTAILCVVVGILIIGTALVPIVEHASQGGDVTVTGTNQASDDQYFLMVTDNTHYTLSIGHTDDYTINGVAVGSVVLKEYVTDENVLTPENPGTYAVNGYAVSGSGSYTLQPAEFPVILVGAVADPYDTTVALDIPNAVIGVMTDSTITVSQGVWALVDGGTFKDGVFYDDAGLPTEFDWITVSENSNGTWTLSSEGDFFAGPQTWTGHETGGTSQYAALYGIIPIMCILGMGYVLIRRF